MTNERFQEISTQGGIANLSDRAKWQLSGADRVRYLNGQVTNDVRKAGAAESIYACVTNLKGRIEGDIVIHAPSLADHPVLVVDAEPGLREPLGVRLERYIIADDVELTDVTEEWQLWHFFGSQIAIAEELALPEGARRVKSQRLGHPGADVWWPIAAGTPDLPAGPALLTSDEIETWRILQGVPRWPQELNGEAFPPEAGIQDRAMDYAKGCYIGQEILSRIKTSGKMPQTLVRVRSRDGNTPLAPGMPLYARHDEGPPTKAGHVTSVARHPQLDHSTGLAYVKQSLGAVHSLLLATEDPPKITFEVDIFSS